MVMVERPSVTKSDDGGPIWTNSIFEAVVELVCVPRCKIEKFVLNTGLSS